ncbi:MAG: FAD-dependent oxidoreductase [Balneolaceae bacterium]|nr:MAG: FAD-dependent oxidoreductase [Balneolaceae bacterium]
MAGKIYDFLIVGSGFAGSITAMVLKKKGFGVCVVEREIHPRFSVGESSTPIADMILRDFSEQYDLPFLKKLSRYGTWQKHYPEVVCGLKRGFSYYPHKAGEQFMSDSNHNNELLIAASENDENSDTNWLRSDVDHFLVKEARKLGVRIEENATVKKLQRTDHLWLARINIGGQEETISCNWIIDATGSSFFSETFFGTSTDSSRFETNSEAVFSHFVQTRRWLDYLTERQFSTDDYPYNPDHSALHQIIDEGWVWLLRFNNELLSAGIVIDLDSVEFRQKSSAQIWEEVIGKYPSVYKLFQDSSLARVPGKLIKTGRLQRMLDHTYGDGWLTLHHTSGFVDPLHSTGIAFTLSGIEKTTRIFDKTTTDSQLPDALAKIQDEFKKELLFIDKLVASCYKSRWYFPLFTAAVMLYFIASVRYEQSRLKGKIPDTFLCAADKEIHSLVEDIYCEIKILDNNRDEVKAKSLIQKIKKRIEPHNSVGLMDQKAKNMYRHTAVEIL